MTWGHGTNGMADECAPSLDPTNDVAARQQPARPGLGRDRERLPGRGHARPAAVHRGRQRGAQHDRHRARRAQAPGRAREQQLRRVGSLRRRPDRDVRVAHRPDLRARAASSKGVVAGAPPSQFALDLHVPEDEPVPLLPVDGGGRAERGVRRHGRAARPGADAARACKLIADLDKGCTGVPRAAARQHRRRRSS